MSSIGSCRITKEEKDIYVCIVLPLGFRTASYCGCPAAQHLVALDAQLKQLKKDLSKLENCFEIQIQLRICAQKARDPIFEVKFWSLVET